MRPNPFRFLLRAIMLMCGLTAAAAAPKTLTIQNMSGDTISAITIVDRLNPERAVMTPLSASISTDDVADLPIDLADGVCLHDITYIYGSGKTNLQENVDLCSTDALIVE